MVRYELALLACVVLLAAGCGGDEAYDHSGYMTGETDTALFTRACQQYLRGSLTASRETFNTLIYKYPDSPLREDAGMGVRRIDSDLSGKTADTVGTEIAPERPAFPPVAIVGIPAVRSTVDRLEMVMASRGTRPVTVEDTGAPDITLVLYSEGSREQAELVADSLSGWLSSHTSVPVQAGGDIIEAVAPGHTGVVVVVGTDAAADPSVPAEEVPAP